jgi:hypothetical protein
VTPCSWSRRRVGGCCWVICCVAATKSAAINGVLKFGGWWPPPVAVPAVSGSPVVEQSKCDSTNGSAIRVSTSDRLTSRRLRRLRVTSRHLRLESQNRYPVADWLPSNFATPPLGSLSKWPITSEIASSAAEGSRIPCRHRVLRTVLSTIDLMPFQSW